MMDRILNNKWSIRIVALLLAAILFTSVNTDNKNSGGTFQTTTQNDTEVIQNVPVEVYYDKKNLYVSGLPETVSVTISGPRSIVQNTKAQQDFKVYADLRNASIGEKNVKLKIKNLSNRLKATISPQTIKVNVQEKVTKKFSVDAELSSNAIASGYTAGNIKISPGKVSITGAKDTVEEIAYVKANVDDSKKHKDDFEAEATVSAFDRNLNKLDVEISPQKVKVKVPVSKVGKSVPLKLKAEGNLPDNISIQSMTADQDEVVVIGDDDALKNIDQITVNVPVANLTADTVKEVTIPVPSGAEAVQPSSIEVRIKTAKKSDGSKASSNENSNEGTEGDNSNASTDEQDDSGQENNQEDAESSKTLSGHNISAQSLPANLTATLISPTNSKVNLTLYGKNSLLSDLNSSNVSVTANLANATVGRYSARIEVGGLPRGVTYSISTSTAIFNIEEKNEE
ncbi:CdaR family protein [Listeria valentina]|uniref:CdaR family protein n=1 Tax=Listeria valentina TaxID=2705293 RepID=UPI00143111C4|nr:CdaR family protein [Listeria valentina]